MFRSAAATGSMPTRGARHIAPAIGTAIWRALPFALATLLLSWTAITNGYPLVFGDSGTYVATGLDLRYPADRPPVYGLAIAPFILAGGMGALVAAQGLLAAVLIHLALGAVDPGRDDRSAGVRLVATCAALALLSSLPWFTGQIMPDFATGLVCLALYVTVARTEPRVVWPTAALLSLLIGFHLSHVLLSAFLIALAGAALAWRHGLRAGVRRCVPATCALIAAVTAVSGMNLAARGRFTPSLSSDMFTLARLFDGRLAQPILAAHCRLEPMRLCAVRPIVDDPAEPKPGQQFLWKPETPLWRLSDEHPDAIRREQKVIIADTYRTRTADVAALAWAGFRDQLVTARTGILRPYGEGDSILAKLRSNLPGDLPAFDGALQQRGRLGELRRVPYEPIGFALLLLSPVVLGWAWATGRHRLAGLAAMMLATILANAAITGALSGPDDRYQSRVLWLPVLLVACALWSARRTKLAPPA